MNAIVQRTSTAMAPRMPVLTPTTITEAMQLAEMMAQGKLVPAALQKSPSDCLMVIEQAMRWGMSPFAVAQEVSVIQGKLMYSGKIVAAAVHTAPGVLEGRLRYDYAGQGADLKVRVTGTLRGESEARDVEVALSSAKTNNQWWQKTPEQMLSYHGARVWARRHAPEVMLGVYAPEEFDGMTIDAAPEPAAKPTRAPPKAAPARQLPSTTIDQDLAGDDIPTFDAPPPPKPKQTPEAWLQPILDGLAAVTDQDAFNDVMMTPKMRPALQAIERDYPTLYAKYEDARAAAMERIVPRHVPEYYEDQQDMGDVA